MDTASERVRRLARDTLAQAVEAVKVCVLEVVGSDTSFTTFEVEAMAVANECVRGALGSVLHNRAQSYGEAVRVAGAEYVKHEAAVVTYHSLCGPVPVMRSTYRQTGVRNGPTIVPLELETGMVDHATPALAKAVALGYAKQDLRSYAEDLAVAHRTPPSRATMERLARHLGTRATREAPRIERELRRTEKLPEGACGVVLGLDRGSVPMAERRPSEQPPATRRRTRTTPYLREQPPPIDVNWRMAPVATVTITDAVGDALQTRKYAAPAAVGWDGILGRAMNDVRASLQEDPSLNVGVAQDGAHELWNLSRAALAAEPVVTAFFEVIDRYHLSERLGEVLRIIEPNDQARGKRGARWQRELDTSEAAIDGIEGEILVAVDGLKKADKEALAEHTTYLRLNKDRMRYATLRAHGLPIGSGATESACNTLLNLRVKRNAEHWSEPGIQGVLTLRGVHQSGRFESFWPLLAHDYIDHVTPILRAA